MANILDAISDELNARLERLGLKTQRELAELERIVAFLEERAAYNEEAARDLRKQFKLRRNEKNWSECFDKIENEIQEHELLAKGLRAHAAETREAAVLAKVTVMDCAAGNPAQAKH